MHKAHCASCSMSHALWSEHLRWYECLFGIEASGSNTYFAATKRNLQGRLPLLLLQLRLLLSTRITNLIPSSLLFATTTAPKPLLLKKRNSLNSVEIVADNTLRRRLTSVRDVVVLMVGYCNCGYSWRVAAANVSISQKQIYLYVCSVFRIYVCLVI